MCEMLRGPYHDAANTLSRSAAKCPRQADAPLPNTHVVEGAAKQRVANPQMLANIWKRSVTEMV